MSFDAAITATSGLWNNAESLLNNATAAAANSSAPGGMATFSAALTTAQLAIGIATSSEQKTSAAIDKAFQAHGQLASK